MDYRFKITKNGFQVKISIMTMNYDFKIIINYKYKIIKKLKVKNNKIKIKSTERKVELHEFCYKVDLREKFQKRRFPA